MDNYLPVRQKPRFLFNSSDLNKLNIDQELAFNKSQQIKAFPNLIIFSFIVKDVKGLSLSQQRRFQHLFFFRRKVIKVVIDFGVGVGNRVRNLIIHQSKLLIVE